MNITLKHFIRISAITSFLLLVVFCAVAQEDQENEHGPHAETPFLPNRLGVTVGYAWIPSGSDVSGQGAVQIVPTFGITYAKRFNEKIGFGWTNEIEFASYVIEHGDEEILEREFAFVSAVVFIYEPIHKLGLFAGPGIELERNQNFFVLKVGAEYFVKMLDDWYILVESYYDIKEVYGAFGLSLSVGTLF